ncbi:MAG: tetratricopeptide repeat protein [Phycisphaeraceae bacterium]
MVHYSRKPAILILALAAVAGYAILTRASSASPDTNDAPALADLQILIAQSDAGPDLWRQYAHRLQQLKQYPHAAQAYQRVLQFDPYDRPAKLQCASVLALAGNPDELASFMKQVISLDPKLAADIFTRPELQTYLTQPAFLALNTEARVQSMD